MQGVEGGPSLPAGFRAGWRRAQLVPVRGQIISNCPGLPPAYPLFSDRAHPVGEFQHPEGGKLSFLAETRRGHRFRFAKRPPWEAPRSARCVKDFARCSCHVQRSWRAAV